jgi:hypothetical protein
MFEDRFETRERYADSGDHVTAVTAGVGAFGSRRQFADGVDEWRRRLLRPQPNTPVFEGEYT